MSHETPPPADARCPHRRLYTPFAIAFLLGLSSLLLVVVFRSVVLPALGWR